MTQPRSKRWKRVPGHKAESPLEAELDRQIRAAGLPEPEKHIQLIEGRKWEYDRVWYERNGVKILYGYKGFVVEVEGGTRSEWITTESGKRYKPRHTSPDGFEEDCRKYNAAVAAGFPVYRATGRMIQSGEFLAFLEGLLL